METINKLLIPLLCVLIFLATGCGKKKEISQESANSVESKPHESSTVATSQTTSTTTTSKTQTKPTTAQITLSVTDAPQGFSDNPDKYEMCLHCESEYARDVLITPSATIRNFTFFLHDYDKYMMEDVCEITQILYTTPALSPQKPFVGRIVIPEFESMYGISYQDENGKTHKFVFGESGLDGSVNLRNVK